MRKALFFAMSLALVFTSCSSEDENSNGDGGSTPVLLTKLIETYEDGSTSTTEYEYSGTKLVEITEDEEYTTFAYDGNLITEIKHFEGSTLVNTETYEYDSNDRVIEYVIIDNVDTDWGNREVYTYNPDGSVSVNQYIGDALSQTTLNDTGIITFLNGEINEISLDSGQTTTYVYDTKKSPALNVTGINKIAFCGLEGEGVLHNIIEADDSENLNDFTAVYIYNSNDFPVSSTVTYIDEVVTEEYFYNQ